MTAEDYRTAHRICRQVADKYAQKLPVWLQRGIDAEELAQVAIIAVWGRIAGSCEDHSRLVTRIAHATIVDHLRAVGTNRDSRFNADRKAVAGELLDPRKVAGKLDANLARLEWSDFQLENLDAWRALRPSYQVLIRGLVDGLYTCEWRMREAVAEFRRLLTPRDCDRLGLNAKPSMATESILDVPMCRRGHPHNEQHGYRNAKDHWVCNTCKNVYQKQKRSRQLHLNRVCQPTSNEE